MTVQTVGIGADPDVLKVGLSDGSFLLLRASFLANGIPYPELSIVLSPAQHEAFSRAADAYAAELTALRLVALREHSRYLLRMKLRQRKCSEHSISLVVDRLTQFGLVDDERFARLWVESRIASKCESRAKLFGGLVDRGISRDTAERVLRFCDDEESEVRRAKKMMDKIAKGAPTRDPAVLKKVRAAGYSEKTIRAALLEGN